jgi:CheY-like chemotaxis protein
MGVVLSLSELTGMILVVDDHADTAEALAKMLELAGYDAAYVTSGGELVRRLRHVKPALIVLDLMMPEMDGLDCLRIIRSDERWKNIPVIIYSADYTNESYRKAVAMGATDFAVKGTVGWTELVGIIGKHLPRRDEAMN